MAPPQIAANFATKPCRDLADYWNGLRLDRRLPARSQIDPGAIRALLPCLYILERLDTAAFVIRLAGTALRQLYGVEMTGRDMLELSPPQHRPIRLWRTVQGVSHPCGLHYSRTHQYASGAVDDVESIFLPVAVDGDPEDAPARQLIGLAASKSGRRWIAEEESTVLMVPHTFEFLDIGFGKPATIAPPVAPQTP